MAVGSGLRADDVPSVDFSELFLLPGIFDCHDHMSFSTVAVGELLQTPVTQWALEAAQQRAADARGRSHRSFATAAAPTRACATRSHRGYVPGPRLQISIVLISQTGGHGDGFLAGTRAGDLVRSLMPEYPGKPPYLVDGPDDDAPHRAREPPRGRRLDQARDDRGARLRARPAARRRSSRSRRSRSRSSRPGARGSQSPRTPTAAKGLTTRSRPAFARSSTAAS